VKRFELTLRRPPSKLRTTIADGLAEPVGEYMLASEPVLFAAKLA
jgi:hypothetical protein